MQHQNTTLSRRTFIGGAAALAASSVMPSRASAASVAKPNSNFNGVQIGIITYSYRSLPGTAEELLEYITQCGISSVELMGGPAEQFAGAPAGKKSVYTALDLPVNEICEGWQVDGPAAEGCYQSCDGTGEYPIRHDRSS